MKKLLLLSLALFLLNALGAQSLIAVQHEGQSSFFTDLQPALDAAVDGDTVYLPGESYNGFQLNKAIHIVGVGYHPDSTIVTGATIISGGIGFLSGSSYSSVSGVYVNSIYAESDVTNVTISRCYIQYSISLPSSTAFPYIDTRFVITENYIGDSGFNSIYNGLSYFSIVSGPNSSISQSNLIANNIISGRIGAVSQSEVSNNVFLIGGYQYSGQDFTNCSVKNNVFVSCSLPVSHWYNNLNCGVNGIQPDGNQGSNNYLNTPPTFVNYSGSGFSFTDDFHLTTNYLGTDGTPVGIYGGLYPWKAGGVPYNPHIQTRTIAPTTNAQGSLNVQIRVAAQGN